MPNPSHPQPGDPLRIRARDWSGMLDILARDRGGRATGAGVGLRQSGGTVLVQNNSGSDVSRFGVLGIDGVVITETDNSQSFKNDWMLDGNTPDIDTHAGRFVVVQEPIPSGKIGRALAWGVTPCLVNVGTAGETWAEIEDDEETRLLSGVSGSARILWPASPSSTGEQWALVSIGHAHTEDIVYAKVTGKTADGMSGDIPWVYDCETLRDGVALTAYNTVEDRLPAGPDYSTAFVPVDTPVLLAWNVSAERWEFSEIPTFEECS